MQIEERAINVNIIIDIAQEAVCKIMGIYNKESFDHQVKIYNSQLAEADIYFHNLISQQLKDIILKISVLSEES